MTIHDEAGPCEPDHHRAMPHPVSEPPTRCRCGAVASPPSLVDVIADVIHRAECGCRGWRPGDDHILDYNDIAAAVVARCPELTVAQQAELSRLQRVEKAVRALADRWLARPKIQSTLGGCATQLLKALASVPSSGETGEPEWRRAAGRKP